MKERPILFSAPMVRALLAGTKAQTRRPCKAAKDHDDGEDYRDTDGWPLFDASIDGAGDVRVACPYGVPGDRLWVRETWMPDPPIDDSWASTQWNGCGRMISEVPERFRHPRFCNYNADWLHGAITWRPSIHMPRWASRITLEVVSVRVERLQDISEADARAEGVLEWAAGLAMDPKVSAADIGALADRYGTGSLRGGYGALWDSINGAGSWDSNPWVWVVEFRRLP